VYKTFVEPVPGSRCLRNLFRGEKRVVHAVNGISFDIFKREVFGLLGANGSGKSTLIRLMSTLLLPDRGELTVFGHDIRTKPHAIRRMINRVSVEAAFFRKMSAWENLRYAARLYGLSQEEGRRKALSILKRFGIPEAKTEVPLENLSRGMQQKVAIVRALMTSPALVLLDEPTTGLDPKSKRDVQNFVEELIRTTDTTFVLTTHDMVEAERLCNRIAILDEGKLIALDTLENLKQKWHADSLEDVFLACTGKSWEEVQANESNE
jgi:ABC-2 type transport system ATP-binding protein